MKFTKDDIGMSVYSLKYGEGIIKCINDSGIRSLIVEFPTNGVLYGILYGITAYYTLDGNLDLYDKTPDLYFSKPEIIAPSKPKKKVKKIIEKWINIYENGNVGDQYDTKEQAEKYGIRINNFITIKLTGEYEVEE